MVLLKLTIQRQNLKSLGYYGGVIQKQINRSTTSGRAYWWGQGENTHDMFLLDIGVRIVSLYKQIII